MKLQECAESGSNAGQSVGRQVAVRPNLNQPGSLTIHPVSPRGRPDYSRALWRTIPGESIALTDVFTHILPGAARIYAGRQNKFPCAAVVGSLLPGAARIPEPLVAFGYNPRLRPEAFVIREGAAAGDFLLSAKYALPYGRQAWAHQPELSDNQRPKGRRLMPAFGFCCIDHRSQS